jgi:uncharacterized repeat protein (TIGR01451 family)
MPAKAWRASPAVRVLLASSIVGLVALGTTAAASPPPTPTPSPARTPAATGSPQLNIVVTDNQTAAKMGDRLTYQTTVRNTGSNEARNLLLTQTASPGLKIATATQDGIVQGNKVSWQVTVKPGASASRGITVIVTQSPVDLLRLASIACASSGAGKAPIVCASDLDKLPAAEVASGTTLESKSASTHSDNGKFWYAGGAIAVAVLVGGALGLRHRRRKARGE